MTVSAHLLASCILDLSINKHIDMVEELKRMTVLEKRIEFSLDNIES